MDLIKEESTKEQKIFKRELNKNQHIIKTRKKTIQDRERVKISTREIENLLGNKGGFINPFGPRFQFQDQASLIKRASHYKQVWKDVYKYTQGESIAKGLGITDFIIQQNLKKNIISHLKLLSNSKYLVFQDKEIFTDYLTEIFIEPLQLKAGWDNKIKNLIMEYEQLIKDDQFFNELKNEQFPLTKKARMKLKGLVTAQEFNAHQRGRMSPIKSKPPTREDSSLTLDSLQEQPFKKKNLPNSSRRSRNKHEGARNQYKTEVLTKKKAIKRFFNSNAFIKHQERFCNILDERKSTDKFNAYRRTSFLTSFSSQLDATRRNKKKPKARRIFSSSKQRNKQSSNLKRLKSIVFRDIRSQGAQQRPRINPEKSRFNKDIKFEKEKKMNQTISLPPKKKNLYHMTHNFIKSKEIIQSNEITITSNLKPGVSNSSINSPSNTLHHYISPRKTTFPKPKNLTKILKNLKRLKSPETRISPSSLTSNLPSPSFCWSETPSANFIKIPLAHKGNKGTKLLQLLEAKLNINQDLL
ncbi:unnamed protein product [Moneuplotes crassus]|uniref:Uncharacterized protein n=1 Tax=Euplotes crassus TaxID=5936 RepID=A0AAD1U1H7_EUPCR|nr:unnamed protein product [Moneuplotes crassus]